MVINMEHHNPLLQDNHSQKFIKETDKSPKGQ